MDSQRKVRISLKELVSSSQVALKRVPFEGEVRSENVLLLIDGVPDKVVERVERAYRENGITPLYAIDGKDLNGQSKRYHIIDLRELELEYD